MGTENSVKLCPFRAIGFRHYDQFLVRGREDVDKASCLEEACALWDDGKEEVGYQYCKKPGCGLRTQNKIDVWKHG